jgi:hypothetical protein
MSLKYNPTTGKYESRTPTTGQGSQSRPLSGREKNAAALAARASAPTRTAPATSTPPPTGGRAAGPPSPVTGAYPTTAKPTQTYEQMIQAISDEAFAYQEATGAAPTGAWYELKMLPITIKMDSDAAAVKKAQADAERRANAAVAAAKTAADKAAAEKERIRAINAGRQAEAFLRTQAQDIKDRTMTRISELYAPMEASSKEQYDAILAGVDTAFTNAEKTVKTAQEQFAANFQPSTAYQGAPVATYSVADNPLLAALQSQGAGTAEVAAATDYARQSAQQTSDLEKWAMSQLNIGQQNYGSAIQNAAQQGTMAGLQQLAARKPEVVAGISTEQQNFMNELAKERSKAEAGAGSEYDKLITEANKIAAGTTADYGNLPKEEKPVVTPKVTSKATPKAAPKAETKPVVKATPQQAESSRLAALAKKYGK